MLNFSLTKPLNQSKINLTVEATDFLFCRQKPFSMREEIPFLQLFAERGLLFLEGNMRTEKQKKHSREYQRKWAEENRDKVIKARKKFSK